MSFVVVPQWQGSPSSRAMRLVDGAEAIRADLPESATRVVEVPGSAGDAQGTGIHRWSSLQLVRERLAEVLAASASPTIVIGGDCSVSAGAIGHVAGPDLAVVWFDAHPDLNTPDSSPSHAFGGMVLASLVDEGSIEPSRVIVVGARSWDDAEVDYAADRGIGSVDVAGLADADAIAERIAATGASRVYVHIDLDVLDPGEFSGLLAPVPFGATASQLVAAVKAIVARLPLAGATIASFAPDSAEAAVDDAPTILRLVAALRS